MIGASVEIVPSFDAITMFFTGTGNLLIEIGEFHPERKGGLVVLEITDTGGASWLPLNMNKLGRGMVTNCTAEGPARFRGELMGGKASGVRVRAKDILGWSQVAVELTFAGGRWRHILHGAPEYVIQEVPDLQDLMRGERRG